MIANLHTHTVRCGHAVGTDRAYVETAVSRGLKTLGFSEHVPMPFPDGHESHYRLPIRLLDDYVSSVLALKQEYRGTIDIRLGFEAEYYPDLFDAMLELLRPYPVEYLLLAQHYNDSSERIYQTNPQFAESALVRYTDVSLEGLRTGRFSCFAHPDLMHFTGSRRVYRREMTRLIQGAAALNIPLEINLLGIRERRNYPSARFWKLAGELGCTAVFGCDAHSPGDVADPDNLREADAFAARFHLQPLPEIPLIKPF